MEILMVFILVIAMLIMAVRLQIQFYFLRINVDNIDEIAAKNLQSRAHFIVMQFLSAYRMADTMEKVIAVRECKNLVEQYGQLLQQERHRLKAQATALKDNVVWLTKPNR